MWWYPKHHPAMPVSYPSCSHMKGDSFIPHRTVLGGRGLPWELLQPYGCSWNVLLLQLYAANPYQPLGAKGLEEEPPHQPHGCRGQLTPPRSCLCCHTCAHGCCNVTCPLFPRHPGADTCVQPHIHDPTVRRMDLALPSLQSSLCTPTPSQGAGRMPKLSMRTLPPCPGFSCLAQTWLSRKGFSLPALCSFFPLFLCFSPS